MLQEMPVMSSGGGGGTPTVDTFTVTTTWYDTGIKVSDVSVISVQDNDNDHGVWYVNNGTLTTFFERYMYGQVGSNGNFEVKGTSSRPASILYL